MRTDTPKTIYLKDYKPSPYQISHIELNFDIHDGYTIVDAKTRFTAEPHTREDLFLNGEDLDLLELKLDGQTVKDFSADDTGLTIPCPHKESFTLEIKTRLKPEDNTRLEGLYKSGDTYCTQCEAEGFRRITYYLDRPDIMAIFTTRIEASRKSCHVLLSNGNRIDHGEAGHGRHYAVWHDPFPKPCYLFALVAGDLTHIEDEFITRSGRKVELYIYVRPGDEGQCRHAMDSLKKAMKWDEETYGLEYDLDMFNIVAVSDFNMGAMENKSLNIFNTALVLAHPETATDNDFMRVESVIAHEYFHNWSGNRVTCRDWFQLSLKEGLTVFRDQEFSADMHSRAVQRIDDVTHLRHFQFPEDAGPLAHPIRPDNYIEINNFYTMTVYEKGAEVIRMLRTILGPENYRKGTDLYFKRHDGQAVTCDDFVKAMEDASGADLTQFRLWYSQAGTPELEFNGKYNDKTKIYTVNLKQIIKDTPGQHNKKPMHIPVAIGLLGPEGEDLIGTEILHLKEKDQSFEFENIEAQPVPSILRDFSAPVILKSNLTDDDYKFLTRHETYDAFNRWEAGQTICKRVLHSLTDKIDAGDKKPGVPEDFLETFGKFYADVDGGYKALIARAITLPAISSLIQERQDVNPETVYEARQLVLAALKRAYKAKLEKIYSDNADHGEFVLTHESMGRRALRNAILLQLTATHGTGCAKLAREHYVSANNMTDRIAALTALAPNKNGEREEVFEEFYERFKFYPLVIDKWFAVQASAVREDFIKTLKYLREHHDFNIKNPNRVRSLYAAFAMNNPVCFHAEDGAGYKFLTEGIILLNGVNPQIAARLLTPMRDWKRYTQDRQEKIQNCLQRILSTPKLAPDVYEIASKSLSAQL